jgi:ABC-type phosphate transport system substrate-binding protein
MKRRNVAWLLALATLLACWTANLDQPARAQEPDTLVMVANKANASAATLNKGEARKLILGQTISWPNGSKVIVAMRPAGNSERAVVLKKLCGMNESEYTRYGLQAMFTGQSVPPLHEVASSEAIKNFVKANPGAIGFLPKSEVDADVKAVLTLD